MRAIAFALLQCGKDVTLFHFAQRRKLSGITHSSAVTGTMASGNGDAGESGRDTKALTEPQMHRFQNPAFTAQDNRAFDDVLEFAHIAGPIMLLQSCIA